MTDNEIIKALGCCRCESVLCSQCPLKDVGHTCEDKLTGYAFDLVNRQKAEIAQLQKRIVFWREDMDYRPDEIKSEAIQEFAERLKDDWFRQGLESPDVDFDDYIDNIVKEMMEEKENDQL